MGLILIFFLIIIINGKKNLYFHIHFDHISGVYCFRFVTIPCSYIGYILQYAAISKNKVDTSSSVRVEVIQDYFFISIKKCFL